MKLMDYGPIDRSRVAIVRGGGDLATGVIYRLWRAGFSVLCLETGVPLVVRRTVAVAQAVFDGAFAIDGMHAVRISTLAGFAPGDRISVLVDPEGESIGALKPDLVVDAIMAKRNLGTHRGMAKLVLAIGPGFRAPEEVHGVVETKRGHDLGRLITVGEAIPNTGIPGMEMGFTVERLLRAPCDGRMRHVLSIGTHVERGDLVATADGLPVQAPISGVLRGLIHESVVVTEGLKIGDIDPRDEPAHCLSITDKALAVGGGILEGVLALDVDENV